MTQISKQIKIFRFNGLATFKGNGNYRNYLIMCYQPEPLIDSGIWYQFMNIPLWDNHMDYFKEKLGIADREQLAELLELYNERVEEKSYATLNLHRVRVYKYSKSAITDKNIVLRSNYSWYKKGNR